MGSPQEDMQVLATLAQYGSDLSKPHRINHYFYFQTESAAKVCARQLQQEGCDVEVNETPRPLLQRLFTKKTWCCFAQKTMVPEQQAVFDTTGRFEKMAQKLGGEYDGWEAPITK